MQVRAHKRVAYGNPSDAFQLEECDHCDGEIGKHKDWEGEEKQYFPEGGTVNLLPLSDDGDKTE